MLSREELKQRFDNLERQLAELRHTAVGAEGEDSADHALRAMCFLKTVCVTSRRLWREAAWVSIAGTVPISDGRVLFAERRIALMAPGDIVVVQSSGRRARIVQQIEGERFQVEFLPDTMDDPIDRDTVQSEDESGVYHEDDLRPVE